MNVPNHFERLGLPRRFLLDAAEVERQYLARSRDVHPDFHQLGSSGEQNASLELTARLNEAYAALRDPFKRAEYLLTLEGGPSASEQKEMPAEFLEEVLELRMEIEELKGQPAESPARVAMARQLQQRRETMLKEIGGDFAKLESGGPRELLKSLRRRLNALKYVQNLLRDLKSD